MPRPTAFLLLALLVPLPLRGQERPTVEQRSWSESTSRALFTSLDASGDDRLDLFEAGRGLTTLKGPGDREGFRRLDRDRNGHLTWPEFDRCYRGIIDRNSVLEVRPARPALVPEEPEPDAGSTGTGHPLLALLDRSGDGRIDRGELAAALEAAGLPAAMLQRATALDINGSGMLEANELAPLALLAPALSRATGQGVPDEAGEAPELAGDRDGDGAWSVEELRRILALRDPLLAHWAESLLRAADRDGDQRVRPDERAGRDADPRGTADR